MSMEASEQHGADCKRKLFLHVYVTIIGIIMLIIITIIVIRLVLRPTNPRFYLRNVSLSQFNLTGPGLLTVAAQATISSKNPNDRVGIYYEHLDLYAVYKGQQVTVPTGLPRGYQGHDDVAVWSSNLYGTVDPVSPHLTDALGQDENAGAMLVDFRVGGSLRWKVGSWTSDLYHLYVVCPAFLTNVRIDSGVGCYKLQQGMVTCSVDV